MREDSMDGEENEPSIPKVIVHYPK